MSRYDIIIIGTGPAGISAAITAKIRNKSFLLIGGKNSSEKVQKAHLVQNYVGLPEINGADLSNALLNHLKQMDISITDERVSMVYAMGSYYVVQTANNMYESDTVILATGVVLGKPIDGETEFLGRGVSYCATCDAALYKGKTVVVIGYNDEAEAEAEFLAEIVERVYYIPRYKEEPKLSSNIEIIKQIPTEIFGEMKVKGVRTKEDEILADGVFVLRDNIAPDTLVPGLKVVDNHVEVNLQMQTNLDGCFACGDITGKPYQYIKAAGQGNVAALSAVDYLDKKKRATKEDN